MNTLSFSCQGESHIAAGKACQDYSLCAISEDNDGIAIVCDGHGGRRYFRSDVGAKIAAEVARRNVGTFMREAGSLLLARKPFTQQSTISAQIDNQDFNKIGAVGHAFRQLLGSIIFEWNIEVQHHAKENPVTEAEMKELDPQWIADFNNNRSLEKVYGCTMIVYAQSEQYWLAFQIGDGKCFTFDETGQWSEPIPWDEKCFLNKTTSICDSSAIDEFRYCFEGDGKFPIAAILGSDGIDDSFGTAENQANFYVQILKSLARNGIDDTLSEIRSTLPQLSKIGSQDDMSLAMVFDLGKVQKAYENLVKWQISNVMQMILAEEEKILKANKVQESLSDISNPTRQNIIDLQYADADEKRALEAKEKLSDRLASLERELSLSSTETATPAPMQEKAAQASTTSSANEPDEAPDSNVDTETINERPENDTD